MLKFILLFLTVFLFLFACNTDTEENKTKTIEKNTSKNIPKNTSKEAKKIILFFGNSLTAGYGLDDEAGESFPGLIQKKIDSLALNYTVVNAGSSGETTAGGNERINWLLKQKIDIFVLELGGNDGLRGISTAETRKNLQEIIDKVRKKYPEIRILLAGMEVPPNMGIQYSSEFRALFKEIAKKNKVDFLPFLLDGVGGEPELNLPDGIHPTAKGHEIVAENVWKVLKGML